MNPTSATIRSDGRRDVHGDDLPSVQALRRIEVDILTGKLRQGSRLASERELSERLGVARNTLRRALQTLETRGLIEARGRGGWIVVGSGVTERLQAPVSFTAWAIERGYRVTSRVIRARTRTATTEEAGDLRVPVTSPIYELERVRYVDGVPISLDRSVLHPRLSPVLQGIDFSDQSLFGTLQQGANVIATRAEVVVRAVPASARSAALLGLAERDPLLELDEITFDQYDEPFETARLLNRGDRYSYSLTTALGAGRSSARVEL